MTKQSGTLHTLRFRFDDGTTFPITALKLPPVDTRERIAAELVPLRIGGSATPVLGHHPEGRLPLQAPNA